MSTYTVRVTAKGNRVRSTRYANGTEYRIARAIASTIAQVSMDLYLTERGIVLSTRDDGGWSNWEGQAQREGYGT